MKRDPIFNRLFCLLHISYDELVNTIISIEKRNSDDVWIGRLRTVSSIMLHERIITGDIIDNMRYNHFLTLIVKLFWIEKQDTTA